MTYIAAALGFIAGASAAAWLIGGWYGELHDAYFELLHKIDRREPEETNNTPQPKGNPHANR